MPGPRSTRRQPTGAAAAVLRRVSTRPAPRLRARRIACGSSAPICVASRRIRTRPCPTEGELNAARAEFSLAELTVEKTRIRALIAGTVLQVPAKIGEIATPSPDQPLVLMADVSALRVRAELDERDIGLVRVGQPVVVRANAFRGHEFEGKVASIAQIVGPGGNSSRGPRKLTDVDVVEVIIDLTNPGPLTIGMQADVYFRNGSPQSH